MQHSNSLSFCFITEHVQTIIKCKRQNILNLIVLVIWKRERTTEKSIKHYNLPPCVAEYPVIGERQDYIEFVLLFDLEDFVCYCTDVGDRARFKVKAEDDMHLGGFVGGDRMGP